MIPEAVPAATSSPGRGLPTRVRYIVLGLTVAAYMITYIDRVAISLRLHPSRRSLVFPS